MDLDILESIRRFIYRWVNTSSSLTADVALGDNLIYVESTVRFIAGDEVALIDPATSEGEAHLYVEEVIDNTTLRITTPVLAKDGYGPGQGSMLMKVWGGKFIQGIYLGNPDNIPMYPAITIMGETKNSSWMALRLTKEDYRFQIGIFVEDDNTEDSYIAVTRLTKAIERGMKKNIYPLVGPYVTTSLIADAEIGDFYIRVEDTSEFFIDQLIILEDKHKAEVELRIKRIIDDTTVEVFIPPANLYEVALDARIIGLTRFIFNSWPADIDYGFVHKGSLLHASTIAWFAHEAEPQIQGGHQDPHLS